MKFFRTLLRVLIIQPFVWGGSSVAEVRDFSTATHLFKTKSSIAAYIPESKSLHIGNLKSAAFEEVRNLTAKGQVFGVIETAEGLLVATGMGRGDLQAPIRVTAYNFHTQQEKIVFERPSERSQVSYFKEHKGAIWITFFDSKFITKTGYFTSSESLPWHFNEVASERLGDAVEVLNNGLVIGRPYGEGQGQDGDLLLVRDGAKVLLPSYRGVRAVAAIGSAENQKLVIGDGWHQNYGQFGQARLSILTWNSESKRYALELIDRDLTQYNFNKVIPFTMGGKEFVAALGNRSLTVYGVGKDRVKQVIYSRTSEEQFFDVVLNDQSKDSVSFVILDRGLHLVTYPL
jgi:hypothetical protein